MFNQQTAEKRFKELLRHYHIKVSKWRKTSSGCAIWQTSEIEVPHIKNTDTFCVCMHEIKHIIDGDRGLRLTQEFECDFFAYEEANSLGFDTTEWVSRMNWHALSRIAMAHNRNLDHAKIPTHIKEWFKEVDFSTWIGKKVFVSHSKTEPIGYTIKLSPKITVAGVRMLLNRRGLMLEKSEIDDSTYGHWFVKSNGEETHLTFEKLEEIIDHYNFDPLLANV